MRKRSKRTVRRIVAPTIVAYCLNPEVAIQERSAVLALRGGWAEGSHYNLLADCRDMLMLAASEKHDKAVIGVCDLAGVALLNIKDRYAEKKTLRRHRRRDPRAGIAVRCVGRFLEKEVWRTVH